MSPSRNSSYCATLEKLYPRTNGGIKLGLENTQKLLDALGNPEKNIPFVVVAGTNGKGSTSSLLAHTLNTAGYKTGLYTSPHLLRFTERIQIGGIEISQDAVVTHYKAIERAESACDYPPTFFECVTAMTLLEFQAQQVDIGILEVGLGGRLDSTNVVPKLLSVITPIGLDHQQFLGDTLAKIAAEKAGIIAENGVVALAEQAPEAKAVFNRIIRERAATQVPLKNDIPDSPLPSFQQDNIRLAFTAAAALNDLGFPGLWRHFESALTTWTWPGRYHYFPTSPPILLDGAHNPHAMEKLFEALAKDPRTAGKPIHTILSAINTKESAALFQIAQKHSTSIMACPSSVGRSLQIDELQNILNDEGTVHHTPQQALQRAQAEAKASGGTVLVTGSLFLLADILFALDPQQRDPAIAS